MDLFQPEFLQRFCSTNDEHHYVSKPYKCEIDGDIRSVATDGRIGVVIEQDLGFDDSPRKNFGQAILTREKATVEVKVSELKEFAGPDELTQWKAQQNLPCPKCGQMYSVDCPECEARGEWPHRPGIIHGRVINRNHLAMLCAGIPDKTVKISEPLIVNYGQKPLFIQGDGWYAFIMYVFEDDREDVPVFDGSQIEL